MSVEERREVFRRFPAEIDLAEFTEWEEGTIADSVLIDV